MRVARGNSASPISVDATPSKMPAGRGLCTLLPRPFTKREHPATASREAQHFIDHNELGLSFEVIVASWLERDGRPSQAVYQHLERGANAMGLTASDELLRFAGRFAKPSYE
jgi:hypothetical protein